MSNLHILGPSNGLNAFIYNLANNPTPELLTKADQLEMKISHQLEEINRWDATLERIIHQFDKTREVQKQCSDAMQTVFTRTIGKLDAVLATIEGRSENPTSAFLKEIDSIAKLATPYVSNDAESLRTSDHALKLLADEINDFSKSLYRINTLQVEQLAYAEAALEYARKKLEDLLQETIEMDFDIMQREESKMDLLEESERRSLESSSSSSRH